MLDFQILPMEPGCPKLYDYAILILTEACMAVLGQPLSPQHSTYAHLNLSQLDKIHLLSGFALSEMSALISNVITVSLPQPNSCNWFIHIKLNYNPVRRLKSLQVKMFVNFKKHVLWPNTSTWTVHLSFQVFCRLASETNSPNAAGKWEAERPGPLTRWTVPG